MMQIQQINLYITLNPVGPDLSWPPPINRALRLTLRGWVLTQRNKRRKEHIYEHDNRARRYLHQWRL
jgi:hypothetical protein